MVKVIDSEFQGQVKSRSVIFQGRVSKSPESYHVFNQVRFTSKGCFYLFIFFYESEKRKSSFAKMSSLMKGGTLDKLTLVAGGGNGKHLGKQTANYHRFNG